MNNVVRTLSKLTLAAVFALSSAASVVATQAAHPAPTGTVADSSGMSGAALPAAAAWSPYHHRGRYAWQGRYWEHRRWHGGYWDRFHHWHNGFWIYF